LKGFIASLTSLIPFLQPYPAWVKGIFAGWILFTAFVLICLLFFRPSPNKPKLAISMLGANVFIPEAEDVKDKFTGIAIESRVWNTGSPSIISKWSLKILPSGSQPVLAQFTKMPDQLSIKGQFNNRELTAAMSLEDKTSSKKVTSDPVQGTLLFYVPLEQKTVIAPTTSWELSANDVFGHKTSTKKIMGDWLSR